VLTRTVAAVATLGSEGYRRREAAYADISRSRLEAAEAEFCGVADLI
jgi:hypothetical protein